MDEASQILSRALSSPANSVLLPSSDLSGKTLADFRVLRHLGQGGMGQVYLAEQVSLKRPIALKILKADVAANPTSLQRFKAEAEAVARATHANIVQVYAFGEIDGLYYMALEYVEGLNLREYLVKKGPPALPLTLSIMRQVAAALQRAGELGIVHRDIKPENILLTRKGAVKVADFGLSRCFTTDQPGLTQSGVTMGTPLYMSPEQIEGKELDPRSDIYSFGVTCYHVLAGDPPFRGHTAFEIALRHVQSEPEDLRKIRPDLPAELCAIVRKMMAKHPDMRYQTSRELLKELNRLRDSLTLPQRDGAAATVPMDSKGVRGAVQYLLGWGRERFTRIAVLTIAVALLGGAVLGWHRSRPLQAANPLDTVSAAVPDAEVPSPQRQHEQFLLAAVGEYENPHDQNQLALGMGHRLELGLFYLDQWRLDDADRFFGRLINNSAEDKAFSRAYRMIGKLGHATVLAFNDQAIESNNCFMEVITDKEQGFGRLRFLNRNPKFLQIISRALAYNAANYEALNRPFPPALQELRKAQPLPAGPARRGRQVDKPTG
jgi:serine/threonine-protein kinase